MKLLFIDETGDSKDQAYLGLSLAFMDARFYPKLKAEAVSVLEGIEWRPDTEFKGAYLFSETKGCSEVQVEKRVEAAGRLLDLNAADSNARMSFHYGRMSTSDKAAAYSAGVPSLIEKVLPRAPSGAGKNLISITYDERQDIDHDGFQNALTAAVGKRGYVVLEHPIQGRSSFNTVGLMYADLVGYLAARRDVISNDAELFEGLAPEDFAKNGKIRKLQSSSILIEKVKRLELYVNE
jgi:hypothetical protein